MGLKFLCDYILYPIIITRILWQTNPSTYLICLNNRYTFPKEAFAMRLNVVEIFAKTTLVHRFHLAEIPVSPSTWRKHSPESFPRDRKPLSQWVLFCAHLLLCTLYSAFRVVIYVIHIRVVYLSGRISIRDILVVPLTQGFSICLGFVCSHRQTRSDLTNKGLSFYR